MFADADVEDNLESDTSRCYKSLSDSMKQSLDSPEKSVNGLTDTADPVDAMKASTQSLDSSASVNTFNVETNIENHVEAARLSSQNGECDEAKMNGSVMTENGKPVVSGEMSVTYTLTNGCLSENACVSEFTVENPVDSTFACNANNSDLDSNICKSDLRNNEHSVKHTGDVKHLGENSIPKIEKNIEGNTASCHLVNGNIEDKVHVDSPSVETVPNGKVSPDLPTESSVTDLTSEISTLSLGDSTSTLASDLSRLTLKDEETKEVGENKEVVCGTGSRPCSGHYCSLPNGDITESSHVQCKTSAATSIHTSKQNRFKELQREGKKKSISTLADR